MDRTRRTIAGRKRAQLGLIAALSALSVLPFAGRAIAAEAEPAGTQFKACSDTAWANYNKCLMSSDWAWERTLCDLVFEADVVWCGSVLYNRIKTAS